MEHNDILTRTIKEYAIQNKINHFNLQIVQLTIKSTLLYL